MLLVEFCILLQLTSPDHSLYSEGYGTTTPHINILEQEIITWSKSHVCDHFSLVLPPVKSFLFSLIARTFHSFFFWFFLVSSVPLCPHREQEEKDIIA